MMIGPGLYRGCLTRAALIHDHVRHFARRDCIDYIRANILGPS